MKRILLIALVTLLSSPFTPSQVRNKRAGQPNEAEVLRLEQDWRTARGRADKAAYERLLADDFTGILYEFEDSSKSAVINNLTPSNLEPLDSYDVRVRFYSHTAVVTGVELRRLRGLDLDKDFQPQLRFTRVWVKRHGRWQLASSHAAMRDMEALHRAAIRNRLRAAKSDAERAEALLMAVKASLAHMPQTPVTLERVGQAEQYIAQLDEMGGDLTRQKIEAHGRANRFYAFTDSGDEKVIGHSQEIITLVSKLDSAALRPIAERESTLWSIVDAYAFLSNIYGTRGDLEKAVATLRQIPAEIATVPKADERIKRLISRHSLMGKPAPPIEAAHWLNTEGGAARFVPSGRVTLIEFTAHWCLRCHQTYPMIRRLRQRFAKDGLDVVFVTQLWGYFKQRWNLKPEEELAALQEYFNEEHQLPVRVAVENKLESQATTVNNEKYFIGGGYPQIVVVDKQGIVRLVMNSLNEPSEEAKLVAMVEKLLAESAVGAK